MSKTVGLKCYYTIPLRENYNLVLKKCLKGGEQMPGPAMWRGRGGALAEFQVKIDC